MTSRKMILLVCTAAVLCGCTQAYYDKKRAASTGGSAPAPAAAEAKPAVTKTEVTAASTNVAEATGRGAGEFGGWLKKQGINIRTKDNPDGK